MSSNLTQEMFCCGINFGQIVLFGFHILYNADPAIDSEHSIPRKMERGQVTRGQMAAKIRNANVKCVRALDTDANATQEENWSPFENCTADDSFSGSLPGIQLIYNSPSLDDVPYVCFSAEDHQRLLKNSLKIYEDIRTKFASKHQLLFDESVMSSWRRWLSQEQELLVSVTSTPTSGRMHLPSPFEKTLKKLLKSSAAKTLEWRESL